MARGMIITLALVLPVVCVEAARRRAHAPAECLARRKARHALALGQRSMAVEIGARSLPRGIGGYARDDESADDGG